MLCHHDNKAHEQADDCRNCKQTQSLSEGTSVMEKLLSGRTKNQKVTQQDQNQNVYHGQISQLILSVQAKVGQPWCWEHSTGIISNNSTVICACRSISFAFSTICLIKVSQKMVGLVDKVKGGRPLVNLVLQHSRGGIKLYVRPQKVSHVHHELVL